MHDIWQTSGYRPECILLTALGKDIGKKYYKWHSVNNEYLVAPNLDSIEGYRSIGKLITKRRIHFFQGYPSNIFKILRGLERTFNDEKELELIKNSLEALFLSSEATPKYMVDYFKDKWGLTCITWYGHSEACALAQDIGCNNEYSVKLNYGYVEEKEGLLISTSFDNKIMPLIRYQTDDSIRPTASVSGVIHKFSITSGRKGELVCDAQGNMVSLTTILFGKHHKIFEHADHVQVTQPSKGHLKFLLRAIRVNQRTYLVFLM